MARTKHSAVFETLKEAILRGGYSSSGKLPSETALTRRFGVSRSVVQQALRELERLGFVVRQQGRGTFVARSAKTLGGTIGLIVPAVSFAEIFTPIVDAISCRAQADGLSVLLGNSFSGTNHARRARQTLDLARAMAEKGVAGVILQPVESVPNAPRINREIVSVFAQAKIPVVLIDYDIVPPPDRSACDLVGIDNFEAGRRVAIHLLAAGAKRIGFLINDYPSYSVRKRFEGVKSVVAAHGGPTAGMLLRRDPSDRKAVGAYLRAYRPDAVVCAWDTLAAHLGGTLASLGRTVGGDILLAGFDDVQHATIMTPPLTTVHQPCAEIGETAYRVLMDRIAHPELPPCELTLAAPLVVRGSTHFTKKRKKGKRK